MDTMTKLRRQLEDAAIRFAMKNDGDVRELGQLAHELYRAHLSVTPEIDPGLDLLDTVSQITPRSPLPREDSFAA